MRPGPDSPIKPTEQVAFYDPGLGAGETDGFSFRRIRAILSSAVGTGIDQNIVDCYCAIIARAAGVLTYAPQLLQLGFHSRICATSDDSV
jgi:hypothetical protein